MNSDQDIAMNAFNDVSNVMQTFWESVQEEYDRINLAPELSSDPFCELSHVDYRRQPAGIITPVGLFLFAMSIHELIFRSCLYHLFH